MEYTDEELRYIEETTTKLGAWLFNTNDRRSAIYETLKEVYEKGKGA